MIIMETRDDNQKDILNHSIMLIIKEPAMVAVWPDERSNPPTANVIVNPIAITVVTDMERSIVTILDSVKKVFGINTVNMRNSTIVAKIDPHFVRNILRLSFDSKEMGILIGYEHSLV